MEKAMNVTILNVLRYEEKDRISKEKTGREKIRIGYVLLGKDAMQDTSKFKGLSEMSYFLDYSDEIWNKLNTKVISQPAEFIFDSMQSTRDPLKTYLKLVCINCKDEVINLV